MRPVIIFAGTTEGRTLSECLCGRQIPVEAFVATEYGETLLTQSAYLNVHTGRMDQKQMEAFFKDCNPEAVVDATHPYAVEASKNISAACKETGAAYIRLIRESCHIPAGRAVRVSSIEEAVEYLKQTEGNILAATGSKELAKYTEIPGYERRVFARVLSTGEVAQACEKLGFRGKNLICMQGPFSKELNVAMLRQFDCRYLVTKEAGKAGGFEEKAKACEEAGAKLILVGRPVEQEGHSYGEVLKMLEGRLHRAAKKRQVTFVGIGMGAREGMTAEAARAIGQADLLIGGKRMLEAAAAWKKPSFCAYNPRLIADYIAEHTEYFQIAVLLSGDPGFYSGAKKLYEILSEEGYEARRVCGVTSVAYFCGRLHMAWEDVCLKSLHGRRANLVRAVSAHPKTFALLGAGDSVAELCRSLQEYGLSHTQVHIGERLGYEDEKITSGTPEELETMSFDGLCVALIVNRNADGAGRSGIDDEEFLRGKAPMTKSEIRSLSVARLRLPKDAIVYDVGAGTGSVSVELALQAEDGCVYAIERNEEACGLIEKNKRRFAASNIEVVHGLAPEAMEGLPTPTHAFIGGSAGNMRAVLQCLLARNPHIRLVVNAITLETIGQVMECLKELPLIEEEILSVSVAKARRVADYHLMTGQNPVWLVVCRGGRKMSDDALAKR